MVLMHHIPFFWGRSTCRELIRCFLTPGSSLLIHAEISVSYSHTAFHALRIFFLWRRYRQIKLFSPLGTGKKVRGWGGGPGAEGGWVTMFSACPMGWVMLFLALVRGWVIIFQALDIEILHKCFEVLSCLTRRLQVL